MAFKPGVSGNPKGRKPGSKNLITKELRKTLKAVISDELEQIPILIQELETRDRLELLIKLLPYCLPKVTTVSSTCDEPIDLSFGLNDTGTL